jgi:formamidopyrimidine-DNA glycosylase
MPEMPEVQAHAERLTKDFAGRRLKGFRPLTFTALKTATPVPESAYGLPLDHVGRRGKFLLVTFAPVTFVIHLMQGGRLLVDIKQSNKPRGGQARFLFERRPEDAQDPPGLLLTEQGTERRAGVWCVPTAKALTTPPLASLGPEAFTIEKGAIGAEALAKRFAAMPNTRIHGFLRDQHAVAGIGRRLANEVCHRAKLSPFAMTRKLGADGAAAIAAAIDECVTEGLADERARPDMSSSKDRPSHVHSRTGAACPVCGDTIRAVEYASYTVNYCPTCQTNGKLLADNTTSKFLK